MQAENALEIIRNLLQPKGEKGDRTRFAVDGERNSLIASGDPETLRIVEALILKLDKEAPPRSLEPIWVEFKLHHVEPPIVQRALKELGITGMNCFADSRTNAVIVRGQKDKIERAAKLIRVLDNDAEPPKAPPATDFAIRFVWLVDKSLATDESPSVPADLADAIAVLRKKMGIGNLRLATQMIANLPSTDDAICNLSGTAAQDFYLELHGIWNRNGGDNRLNVVFSASRSDRNNNQRVICKLETTCSGLVPGRPTIVGMTTVNSVPSVLVIELLPKEAK